MNKQNLFETPVLFLIFNRPDLIKIVFERIRKVRPKQLFIAADGPRKEHPEDVEKCESARKIVLDMIDWDCEVRTIIRKKNLGCGLAVSQAITWFFEHVEEGIILEDDCMPDLSFFSYCSTLLEYYKLKPKVMHISGNNFQQGKKRGPNSYYFSKYTHCWGWATWKRAWQYFVYNHELNHENYSLVSRKLGLRETESNYWWKLYHSTHNLGKIDSWAYRWQYSVWRQNAVCILPNKNLVLNLGFNKLATHTVSQPKNYSRNAINSINPNSHPKNIKVNQYADKFTFKNHFTNKSSLTSRFVQFIKKYIRNVIPIQIR